MLTIGIAKREIEEGETFTTENLDNSQKPGWRVVDVINNNPHFPHGLFWYETDESTEGEPCEKS